MSVAGRPPGWLRSKVGGRVFDCIEDADFRQLSILHRSHSGTALGCYRPSCNMTAAHPVFHTFVEYVRLEENSPIKHEYLAGHIYAMGTGTPEHAALAMAVGAKLALALAGGRCRVFSSDLRIRVRSTGLGTYPDVSVVCGPRELDPEDTNTVTNPTVLVEVTSKSTEEYDRGEKFEHCREILSLREYVLVSHREPAIEVRRRGIDGTWASQVAHAGESVALESVPCVLGVTEIYQAASDPRD
jgi:Uma2 family endonuclease